MFRAILLLALLVVVLVIAVLHVCKMKTSTRSAFRYLNANSTAATITGRFNPSDLGYEENRVLRSERNHFYDELKHFVNASPGSKVIHVSGATEAIATCINWAKHYNRYGAIVGSDLDHDAVKANCDAYEMRYAFDDSNVAAYMVTLVGSRTGEINDMKYNVSAAQHAKGEYESTSVAHTFKPLVFVDASQAITRYPINMKAMKADALFFSLHKIGGPHSGILIIDEKTAPFHPLIAGTQNGGLRGGTQDDYALVQSRDLFKMKPSIESRRMKWEAAVGQLKSAGIHVVEPSRKHLYNTILITDLPVCAQAIVDLLAKRGIYVGTSSACENERSERSELSNGQSERSELSNGQTKEAPESSQSIRISFDSASDIDETVISEIAAVINEPLRYKK